ncbi:Kef family K(+) transporter [Sphingomonas koreensis]|uniref:Kef family K(+) transporter n=1 Tax=Sphingomonas koreensis TaxID=93064 RepID=A0A430FY54_9SPHN|nr:YbaL family putative K(+) efflux transporter [Sphingomonas koreensis]RSY76572.1 Kef family K(+) transporter [Sphingomonas koreensis]
MHHDAPLIATIVAGLVAAFIAGTVAHRLKISPIAGYLLAGVLVGPSMPGFAADPEIASQLAEIGVILLMFGVGLHFSLRDILSVKKIAVPGALIQIVVATLLGMALAWALGWRAGQGLVFGLALSVASTVVLVRALQVHNLVQTDQGRIAVGWLVVEDLVMVLALVLLPSVAAILSGTSANAGAAAASAVTTTLLKVAGFIALMLLVGRRVMPAVLHWVADTGSRELFRLAVLAIALGVAFGAAFVFDVSFALGAFFAGMILGETQLSRLATEEILPFRDAFSVLFFVSAGMLFNPAVILAQPGALLATLAIILVGKSAAAYAIVRSFGYRDQTAITISASLAQIGEFSFILAGLGVSAGLLPPQGRDLILAAAIISIFLNPLLFSFVTRQGVRPLRHAGPAEGFSEEPAPEQGPPLGYVIIVGYGRVGRFIAATLGASGYALSIVEDSREAVQAAQAEGLRAVQGNATEASILTRAGIAGASTLLIAIPEGFEAAIIAKRARAMNPDLRIIARAHSEAEVDHLQAMGADAIVLAEKAAAAKMAALVSEAESEDDDGLAHLVES